MILTCVCGTAYWWYNHSIQLCSNPYLSKLQVLLEEHLSVSSVSCLPHSCHFSMPWSLLQAFPCGVSSQIRRVSGVKGAWLGENLERTSRSKYWKDYLQTGASVSFWYLVFRLLNYRLTYLWLKISISFFWTFSFQANSSCSFPSYIVLCIYTRTLLLSASIQAFRDLELITIRRPCTTDWGGDGTTGVPTLL